MKKHVYAIIVSVTYVFALPYYERIFKPLDIGLRWTVLVRLMVFLLFGAFLCLYSAEVIRNSKTAIISFLIVILPTLFILVFSFILPFFAIYAGAFPSEFLDWFGNQYNNEIGFLIIGCSLCSLICKNQIRNTTSRA